MRRRSHKDSDVDLWRERIVDVAQESCRRIGHQMTSVADIASCLGMSSATIYRFFSIKERRKNLFKRSQSMI